MSPGRGRGDYDPGSSSSTKDRTSEPSLMDEMITDAVTWGSTSISSFMSGNCERFKIHRPHDKPETIYHLSCFRIYPVIQEKLSYRGT